MVEVPVDAPHSHGESKALWKPVLASAKVCEIKKTEMTGDPPEATKLPMGKDKEKKPPV